MSKGDGNGTAFIKKKAMKTKSHNTKSAPGLRDQSSIHQSQATDSVAPAPVQTPQALPPSTTNSQPSTTVERPPLPPINFARRRATRELSTERVIQLIEREAPRLLDLAEVVGKWVWIQFTDKQPRDVTARLAELGFH